MPENQTITVNSLLEDEHRRHLEDAAVDAMMAFVFKSDEDGAKQLVKARARLKDVARQCLNAGLCLEELPVRLVARERYSLTPHHAVN